MLVPFLLSWTLLVQVQLSVCDKTGCQPHPTLKETQREVATVRSEAECLTLQIQTQQQLNTIRNRRPAPTHGQRHVEARATLRCVQAKES
jgi:predicted component of type VI protein secretion system